MPAVTSYGSDVARKYHHMRTVDGGIKAPYNTFIDMPGLESVLRPIARGKHVLDAGCGTGIFTARLVQMGALVSAIDISPEMIDIARTEYPGIGFDVMDAADMAFPDRGFDIISSGLMVHYKPDLNPLFAEMNRVLKIGGRLVYTTGHPTFEMLIADLGSMEKGERYIHVQPYFRPDRRFTWTMPGEDGEPLFEMVSYRYNIQDHTRGLYANGFLIAGISELRPVQALEAIDQELYRFTTEFPSFILYEAMKIRDN
jgi:ubiquinone/menaquinone biosynthesis C-methylase UbiE